MECSAMLNSRSLTRHPLFEEIVEMMSVGFTPDDVHAMEERYRASWHIMPSLPSKLTLKRYATAHIPEASADSADSRPSDPLLWSPEDWHDWWEGKIL
jgi:hypothetical protein